MNTPVQVYFNNEDVRRSLERPRLREAWYKFTVKGADTSGVVEKSGNVMHKLTCAPLDETGNARWPTVGFTIFAPLVNADWVGPNGEKHKAPSAWGAEKYLVAACPDRFTLPDRRTFTNTEFKEEQYKLRIAVCREMQERHGDPNRYIGDTFYGKVENNGKYQNITEVALEPPPAAEVLVDNFVDRDYNGDD